MRRLVLLVALVCASSVAGASVASAQSDGFKATTTDFGPVVGFGGLSGAGAGFGGRFEKGFKDLPDLHMGKLGIGVSFDYWSFNTSFVGLAGYDYKDVPITVTVNYHLGLDNKKIDPFFGAGFGYEHFSVSGPSCIFAGVDLCTNTYSNGGYFVGHGGIRYYWRPKLALFGDVATGTGSLHVGIMFKLSD